MIKQLTENPERTLILGNGVIPLLLVFFFRFANLPMVAQATLAYGFVALLLFTNLVIAFRVKRMKRVAWVLIILNLFSFIFAGDISFFTSIPDIPFIIKSYMTLISQNLG